MGENPFNMNTQKYNQQQITEYLCGSLSEAETGRFDELSFTDDEFADALKIAEDELVDAYVNGELGGERLEKFKSHYLATPLRREKVEFARNFQVFAAANAVQPTGEVRRASFFSFFDFFAFLRFPGLQWGLAATAILILLFGGWTFWQNQRLQNQISDAQARRDELERREQELQKQIELERSAKSETERDLAQTRAERERLERELTNERAREQLAAQERQKRLSEQRLAEARRPSSAAPPPRRPLSVVSFILSPPLRGANQLPTLSVPADTDSAAIRLQLDADDYAAYQVELRGADDRVLRRTGKIKSRNRALNLNFPAGLFKPQIYSLRVSGVTEAGTVEIVGDYSFKIVR